MSNEILSASRFARTRGLGRRDFLRGLAVLTAGGVLAACGSAAPSTRSGPPSNSAPPPNAGTSRSSAPAAAASSSVRPAASPASGAGATGTQKLNIAYGQVPRNMDGISSTALADYQYFQLVYDTLVNVDSGKPAPAVAESWTASDPTNWTFKLRQGVKFSNGEDLDANAVKFTVDRALADPKNPWKARIKEVKKVTVADKYAVNFQLAGPVGNLPTRMSVVWLQPPKYTQEKGPGGVAAAPIGSGPFVVKDYKPNESMTLVPNKTYWGGAPAIGEVNFRAMPEPSTRLASLLSGESHVAMTMLPEQVNQMKSKGMQVISVPTGQSGNVFFQTSRDTPVKDVRVRQAMDYAVDKTALFQGMTAGYGRPLNGQMVGPNSVGYSPNIKARPYDPSKARQLLRDAGFPNGFSIAMDTSLGRYYRDKEVTEAFASYLSQVDIKVEMNHMQSGAWLDRLYSGKWGPLNYWSIQDAPAYDLAWTLEIFMSDNLRKILADKKFDQMLTATSSITDAEKRNKALQDVGQYFNDQAYTITLFQDPGLYGVAPNVKGITFLPSTYVKLNKVLIGA
ncbi:MAG: hypothetical protein KGJ86_09730 [Chloroflexota bacterium]|nr:hypothetical protein [Chloroflexota bacterium]